LQAPVQRGGAPFSVDSAPVGRDAALIGLGATLQTGRPVSLYLAYNGAFAKNANAQTLTGGISVQWREKPERNFRRNGLTGVRRMAWMAPPGR